MYQMFNTNFHEIQKKKKLKKELARMPELVKESVREDPLPSELIYP